MFSSRYLVFVDQVFNKFFPSNLGAGTEKNCITNLYGTSSRRVYSVIAGAIGSLRFHAVISNATGEEVPEKGGRERNWGGYAKGGCLGSEVALLFLCHIC